jgi:hypothetical protein
MASRKRELARFCAEVERSCGRMNSSLSAVAVVLATTTFFVGGAHLAADISHDPQWGKLPYIEMAPDSPDVALWAIDD